MLVSKTLKCKVFNPTQKKLQLLSQEYANFQIYARSGKDFGMYSLTKVTYDFKYKRKARKKKQPMPLHNQSTRFKITDNKLSFFIEYKAHLKGIAVIKIREDYTSKTCSRCGEEGKRIKQGLFKCPNCKYQANADYNGAMNILKRSWEHVFQDGAVAFSPEPPMSGKTRAEAHDI